MCEALRKILASPMFVNSARMSRFLQLAVERTLEQRGEELKEYVIGVEVFDRSPSFDPRIDPIVRVEARRLRAKLKAYYESVGSQDEVIVYDLRAERVEGRIEVSTWPAHAVFSRDARLLYVSGETAGDVTVIDTTNRSIVQRIVHGGGDAMGLAVTADGKVLYAAAGENKAILKIDTSTYRIIGEIAVPGVVHEATLTLDGQFLYATLRKTNKVVVIRTSDDKLVATIPQRGYPDLVTMEPSGRYALVTNRYADQVAVIDISTHREVRAIPVGKAPHGMALRPR